jgi:uncharacterized protein
MSDDAQDKLSLPEVTVAAPSSTGGTLAEQELIERERRLEELGSVSNLPGFSFDPFRTDTLISLEDPFIGTIQQTSRMRAFCKIVVAGVDVTDKMEPHLISLRTVLGTQSTMEIELDDRDASLPLPPLNSTVTAALGWESEGMVTIFKGFIDDLEHGFGRKQGGRRMWIHCSATPYFMTALKTPINDHLGEGAPPGKQIGNMVGLTDWIQQLTKNAGIIADINPFFGRFKSDYWDIANASVMHQLSKLSQVYGFVHQFDGQDEKRGMPAVKVQRIGQNGLSCHATWRDNLIGWRVRPFVAREGTKGAMQDWFDARSANWKSVEQAFGLTGLFGGGQSQSKEPTPAANETGAKQQNEAAQLRANVAGPGRIIINGEPRARWNSYVLLSGARPGVDGLYWIDTVEHIYSRSGFITTLEVFAWTQAPADQNVSRSWLPKSALGTAPTDTPGNTSPDEAIVTVTKP